MSDFNQNRNNRNQSDKRRTQENPYASMARPPQKEPLSLDEWMQQGNNAKQPSPPTPEWAATDKRSRSDQVRSRREPQPQRPYRRRRRVSFFKVISTLFLLLLIGGVLAVYFLFPGEDNVLILGLDRSLEEGKYYSRADTIILTQFKATLGEVSMLSIPRDTWVTIPGYGENRINTAHYFPEVYQTGSGIETTSTAIKLNFNYDTEHYVRVQLEEFPRLINAMGGVTLILEEPMGGLDAGEHKLNGDEALKFVRDRKSSDDFGRQKQAQVFIQAVTRRATHPLVWLRAPLIIGTAIDMVDTDIPVWLWPRYGMTLYRAIPDHLNAQTMPRELVTGYITADGANVLLPNLPGIQQLVAQMFY
ncbi:MAG: LCP family protein [Anaerolineaceae bacterium]|nr:LCP family protein [Anaerolineaceae bacterium]